MPSNRTIMASRARTVQGLMEHEAEEKPVNKRVENRRNNLRRQIQLRGGPKEFAALVDKPQSFISQMCGPHPSRPVSEDTARAFEKILGLREGELDWPAAPAPGALVGVPPAEPAASTDSAKVIPGSPREISEIIATLIGICREDKLTLPDMTFADIASIAIIDAAETGKRPAPEKLRMLIALATRRGS
jgi:hypothetical protein